jgi:hypothetical protein
MQKDITTIKAGVAPALHVSTYAKSNIGSLDGGCLNIRDYADADAFSAACLDLHRDEADPDRMGGRLPIGQPAALRTYVVTLQADDGQGVKYYVAATSADAAKEFACAAELAPPGAVVSVQVRDFREGQR